MKEFVRVVNTTSKETILKGWEKTRLAEAVLQNPETEVEFLLQAGMEDLMLDTESEILNADGDISDSEEEVEVVVESQNARPKKPKQSQITDFFRTDK